MKIENNELYKKLKYTWKEEGLDAFDKFIEKEKKKL